MLVYLLKSSACLIILLVFYKLLLEKENVHVFKRFFLLGSLIASFIIPTLVLTEHVEVIPSLPVSQSIAPSMQEVGSVPQLPVKDMEIVNWPLLLWSIYAVGLILFGFRFVNHLYQIIRRIQKNTKQKLTHITHVLHHEKMPPHTFFRYIFLNKIALEKNTIPSEVLLHEETHAKQYHGLDVLFIELLHLIFWFNLMFLLYKRSIKLNHEFLADHKVLKENVDTKTYQNTLLSNLMVHSDTKHQPVMANAINYSSIKKRFTVMRKEISKTALGIRSILLLPLISLLIFGFSERKIVHNTTQDFEINGIWLDRTEENYAFSIASDGHSSQYYSNDHALPIIEINNQYFIQHPTKKVKLDIDHNNRILKLGGSEFIKLDDSHRKKYEGFWESTDGKIQLQIENYTDALICNLTINGTSNNFYPKWGNDTILFSYGHKIWSFKFKNETLYDSKGNIFKRIENPVTSLTDSDLLSKGLTQGELAEYEELVEKYMDNKVGKSRILFSEISRMLYLLNKMSDMQKRSATFVPTSLMSTMVSGKPAKTVFEDFQKDAGTISEDVYVKIKGNGQVLLQNRITVKINELAKHLQDYNRHLTKTQRAQHVRAMIEVVDTTPEALIKKVESIIEAYGVATIDIRGPLKNPNIVLDVKNDKEIRIENTEIPLERLSQEIKKRVASSKDINMVQVEIRSHERLDHAFLSQLTTKIQEAGISKNVKVYATSYSLPENLYTNTIDTDAAQVTLTTDKIILTSPLQEGATKAEVKEYNALARKYNAMEKNNYHIIGREVERMKSIYDRMTEDQKAQAEPLPSLPAPPPPPPPDPLDHIIDMAKQGAIFYYKDKKITSDEAIAILKKNKSLNIRTIENHDDVPVVKISKHH